MNAVAIIQARVGSTRLPAKVLADIAGQPMLARVVERAARIPGIDDVVVATSRLAADDAIAEMCGARGWRCTRGSEDDVLLRYVEAASEVGAAVIVRVTSDCPLLDPEVGGRVVAVLTTRLGELDYVSNTLRRTFPRGLDVEAVSREALERAHREARDPASREHVTRYIYQHPDVFRIEQVVDVEDRSALRWTVDTEADLALVREIYAALGDRPFRYAEVLALCDARPELTRINAGVEQKPS